MARAPEITINHDAKPSEKIIADAKKSKVIKDDLGREIGLSKPNVIVQFKLVQMVGAQNAANEIYMRMLAPLTYVTSFEGAPVQLPTSMLEMEALINRLDETGVSAVMTAVNETWGATDPAADKEALKNLS